MKFHRLVLAVAVLALCVSTMGCATTKKQTMTDQQVADQIKANLEAPTGPEGPFKIDVFAHKGDVTLDGNVGSPAAKEKAMDVAHTTGGVKDVKSFLAVQ